MENFGGESVSGIRMSPDEISRYKMKQDDKRLLIRDLLNSCRRIVRDLVETCKRLA